MNTITNYTDATLYHNRSAFADLATGEIIPSYPIFALHKGGDETIVFDERKYSCKNQQRLIDALKTGIISEFDQRILCLIGTFSNVSITTKIVSELIVLMGYTPNDKIRATVDKSVQRLWRYGLIDSFHFKAIDVEKICNTRIFNLTKTGFCLVRSWGVTGFYYNAIDIAGRSVAEHKRNCATAQAVACWLKHVPSLSFSFRKTIKDYVENDKEAIVRPSATIVAGNTEESETIYVETVRRTKNNAEDLLQKLHRYNLVFSYMGVSPALVIVGEDELHTRELFDYLASHNINMDKLVFTHDLAISGVFWSAFYTFEGEKRIQLHIA